MAGYAGRINNDAEIYNFLGINNKSSIVDGRPGEAIDIDNWDVDLSGAITRREGYSTQYSFPGNVNHFDTFFKLDGTQVYVAVYGGELYESTSPSGPWTNRGGSLTTGDFTYIGSSLNGVYVLCNGVDSPIVFTPGSSVQTLESASTLIDPTNLVVSPSVNAGGSWQYVVTSCSPRGETLGATAGTVLGPASINITNYNTLTWTPATGAFTQKVYRYITSTNTFDLIATLTGTANAYTDNGATNDIYTHPPTVSSYSAPYNTPADWVTSGQPEGVYVISRGKDQRMLAWRKSFVWVSALSNIYDWYTTNDSFSFYNLGGQDNNVTAVTTLYDYTVIFSKTNAFIYTGSSYSDWALSKILNTGCPSHYAIAFVGDTGLVWSQFGPSTIERILSGQDVSTTGISQNISPIIYNQTELSQWSKIRSWHDLQRQRVCFAVPGVGQTKNTMVLAYNYQTKGWTKFSGWSVENIAYDPTAKLNYAVLDGTSVVLLHSGNTDGGTRVDNSYSTVYEHHGSWSRKRNVFLDIMMDPAHPYEVDVTLNTDFEDESIPTQTYHLSFDGTTAKTDNESVVMQGAKVITHRIVVNGYSRHYGLVFEDTASSYPASIYGYRLESRSYGIR